MKRDMTMQTRRSFLRTTVLGGAFAWTIPTFLADTFAALEADAANARQVVTGKDGTILVILQMAGGNDGLNTVVPYGDDFYRKARPRIGLKKSQLLTLNHELALHGGLEGLKELYDAGRLGIIQGVGYPNPNRSHFRSTEIWQTASDADRFERYGWLGRYFDNACSGADPTVGVNVGRQMPQAFAAKDPKGISLDNPQAYRFMGGSARDGEMSDTEESYRKLNMMEENADDNSGGTIGAIAGASPAQGSSALDFIERTALDAQVSSDKIREVSDKVKNQATYPGSQLANSLKLIARLIGGGLPTRIFYASQGGYDTHTNQAGNHERLLRDLGDSLKAFTKDLKAQGNLDRVMIMTFSEFGRRVAENANAGTDHGAAAPMFVIGRKIKQGLLGRYPSLAPQDLNKGDLKFTVDFRSVYATVLENWLKTPSEQILKRKFPLLEFVRQ
jgi:uncharacterized protein (DUF1501 family)